jgi:hypothetical protein
MESCAGTRGVQIELTDQWRCSSGNGRDASSVARALDEAIRWEAPFPDLFWDPECLLPSFTLLKVRDASSMG